MAKKQEYGATRAPRGSARVGKGAGNNQGGSDPQPASQPPPKSMVPKTPKSSPPTHAPRGAKVPGTQHETKPAPKPKPKGDVTRAPRGPQRAGESKKAKPEKRGRIPGGGDTVARPGKNAKNERQYYNNNYREGQ